MSLKQLGLHRLDIRDIAETFHLKHTPHCRETNRKFGILYTCICPFFEEIKAKCFALAFDGRDLFDFQGNSIKWKDYGVTWECPALHRNDRGEVENCEFQ